jgi:hypothetical protein
MGDLGTAGDLAVIALLILALGALGGGMLYLVFTMAQGTRRVALPFIGVGLLALYWALSASISAFGPAAVALAILATGVVVVIAVRRLGLPWREVRRE